jgi:hypothetical protein
LLLEAAVPDLTEAAEEDCPGEGVASFAFVEAGMNAAAEIDALKPRQDEQGSLDAAQLAKGNRETVLARILSLALRRVTVTPVRSRPTATQQQKMLHPSPATSAIS